MSVAHPDKGGDPRRFNDVQQAYSVLSDQNKVRALHTLVDVRSVTSSLTAQRRHYDSTGEVEKTADEEFMDVFAGGSFGFSDCVANDTESLLS